MMGRSVAPAALAAVALLVSAAAFAAPPAGFPAASPFGEVGVTRCATPEPSVAEMDRVQASLRRAVEEMGAVAVGGQIRVVFHVISNGSEGNIPDSQIAAQIAELNKSYAGGWGGFNTGYTFVLDRTTRTSNRQWFKMTPGSRAESQAKNSLAVDPLHRLNIYSCKPGQNLLGWATFPWSYPEADKRHGVVIHYGSVPGGYLSPYNLGGTADHEVGHYLGLYHTFQGGCTAPGDYVDDTPYQATSTSGCPEGKDTCPSTGLDPIHNYMDYSTDACYTQFTSGQDTRMDQLVPAYRPNLLNAAIAQAVLEPAPGGEAVRALTGPGVMFRGGLPNPFSIETSLRYYLPRSGQVSLKVYNVAGQLVATLVDGVEPAGEHTVPFRAGALPAGMYFTALRVGGEAFSRSVILVR